MWYPDGASRKGKALEQSERLWGCGVEPQEIRKLSPLQMAILVCTHLLQNERLQLLETCCVPALHQVLPSRLRHCSTAILLQLLSYQIMPFDIVHSGYEHDKMRVQGRRLRQIEKPSGLRIFQHILKA